MAKTYNPAVFSSTPPSIGGAIQKEYSHRVAGIVGGAWGSISQGKVPP